MPTTHSREKVTDFPEPSEDAALRAAVPPAGCGWMRPARSCCSESERRAYVPALHRGVRAQAAEARGRGAKAGERKGPGRDASWPPAQALEAVGCLSGLSIWEMEVDTCLLQLRSHIGQSPAPLDIKSPALPVCTRGC